MSLKLFNQTQQISGVNIGQPLTQSPSLNLALGNQKADQAKLLWKGISDATTGGLKLGLTWLEQDRAANVAEQANAFNRELMLFQTDYKKNNQGKDALQAGVAFDEFASATLQRYMDEGNFDNAERAMFTRSTSATATSFMGQGYSYAAEQDKAWKTSVAKGALSELNQFVAVNYNNTALVEAQKELVKEELAAIYPGLDTTAQNAAIDQEVALNQIGGFLADRNFTAAESLLTNNRALLGDKADEMTYRITAQKESQMRLALAQQARQDRLALAALEKKKHEAQKDIIDAVESGNVPLANEIIQGNRSLFSGTEYNTAITWTKPKDGGVISIASDRAQKAIAASIAPRFGKEITVDNIIQAEKLVQENYDILTPEQFNSSNTKIATAIENLGETKVDNAFKEILIASLQGDGEKALSLLEKHKDIIPSEKYQQIYSNVRTNLANEKKASGQSAYKDILSRVTPTSGKSVQMSDVLQAYTALETNADKLSGEEYSSLRTALASSSEDVQDTEENNILKDILVKASGGDLEAAYERLQQEKGILSHKAYSDAKSFINKAIKDRKEAIDEVVTVRNDITLKEITRLSMSSATGELKVIDIAKAQALINNNIESLTSEQYTTATNQVKDAVEYLVRGEGEATAKSIITDIFNGSYEKASNKLQQAEQELSADLYKQLQTLLNSQREAYTKAEEKKDRDTAYRGITILAENGNFDMAIDSLNYNSEKFTGEEYAKLSNDLYNNLAQVGISDAAAEGNWKVVEEIAKANKYRLPSDLYDSIVSGELKQERDDAIKKQKQEAVLKNLVDFLSKGQTTQAGVLLSESREVLQSNDYATWLNRINGAEPATKDDMIAFRTMEAMRKAEVPPEELREQAMQYYMTGRLTKATLDDFSGNLRITPEQKLAYQESENLITASLGSDYNPATAETKVNLLNSLYTYRSKNPQATPEEIRAYGQEIVRNNSIVDINSNPAMVPLPMYLNRQSLLKRDSAAFQNGQKKLIELHKQGRITREYYYLEMQKYRNVQRFFTVQ